MKSKDIAVASIILAALSWIPLLNFAIAPAAFLTGLHALKKIKKSPDKYEGKLIALIGLLAGGAITVFSYSWLILNLIR